MGASTKRLEQVTLDMSDLVGVRKIHSFQIMLSIKGSRVRLIGIGFRPPNPRSTIKTFLVVGEEWRRLLKKILF